MTKISIIIPVYNSLKYIKTCLDSIINQKLKDIQIIVIDDNSNDRSYEILEYYQKRYSSLITLVRNKQNIGQSASRNIGITLANGEYITFVDSDDFIHPNMYHDLYQKAIINGKPDLLTTKLVCISENENPSSKYDIFTRGKGKLHLYPFTKNVLISENPSCCTKLFKHTTFRNARFLRGKMWEDYAFAYSSIIRANSVYESKNADYFYRQKKKNGISASARKVNLKLLNCFDVADEIERQAIKYQRYNELEEEIKLLQYMCCLQRIEEISKWKISKEDKIYLSRLMEGLIYIKYGDWADSDIMAIMARCDLYSLKSQGLIDSNVLCERSTEEMKNDINRKLITLKAK